MIAYLGCTKKIDAVWIHSTKQRKRYTQRKKYTQYTMASLDDDSDIIDLRRSTETIENSHVAQKSRMGYIRQLCNFMHFLYCNDLYQHLLTKISLLHVANDKDKADYQSALERRRRRSSSRSTPKVKNKHFMNECQRQC